MLLSPISRVARYDWSSLCHVRSVVILAVTTLSCCPAIVAQTPPSRAVDTTGDDYWGKPQNLLQNELGQQWKHFSSVDNTPLTTVWTRVAVADADDTELICSGKPRGYLYSSQQFEEFELSLEWRYDSDPNGNSGILVFTQNDRRLWPTSVQIQLHQPEAGSVFPSGTAETDQTVKTEGLAKPVGKWNQCRVVSRSGRVLVHINGKKAGEVSGCKPTRGCIALQSEGSVVHFRRIRVRTPAITDEPTVPAPVSEPVATE